MTSAVVVPHGNIREDAAGFLVNTGQLNSINCRREIFVAIGKEPL